MKKLAVFVASLMVSMYAYGQGTVIFDTTQAYPEGWAKVGTDMGPMAEGPQYVGQLFGGLASDAASFTPIASPLDFGQGDLGGYIMGGTVTVDGVFGASPYYLQLRAWDIADPASVGQSPVLSLSLGGLTAGGTTLPAPDLSALGNTVIPVVPEPTTIALGLLGGAALLLFRRK
jgi:hypothetical protein